jgi:predicted MFS family arabinose efflux permease
MAPETLALLIPILVPAALFAAIYGIFYIKARNRERLAMIEKGYDASLLEPAQPHTGKYSSLKMGIAAIGIAIGLLAGNILVIHTNMEEAVGYFSMIFLFGGLGLIVYYLLVRNKSRE